ncbi:MAG: PseG/SpsG family protein, partial [Verrucomicrobiota bacterium]
IQHELDVVPGLPVDAHATGKLAKEIGAELVVADGYHFGPSFQKIMKQGYAPILIFDDYGHCEYYPANWIVNQNRSWQSSFYEQREQGSQLLTGTEHVVLRAAFRSRKPTARRSIKEAERLLVTFGGADHRGMSARVAQALLDFPPETPLQVRLLIGRMAETEALEPLVGKHGAVEIEMVRDEGEIIDHLDWADFALSAGGTTVWELLYLGVPSLILLTAGNQTSNCETLATEGILRSLGPAEKFDPETIAEQVNALATDPERRALYSIKGRQIVDGKGCERIFEAIHQQTENKDGRSREEILLESFLNRSRKF